MMVATYPPDQAESDDASRPAYVRLGYDLHRASKQGRS